MPETETRPRFLAFSPSYTILCPVATMEATSCSIRQAWSLSLETYL